MTTTHTNHLSCLFRHVARTAALFLASTALSHAQSVVTLSPANGGTAPSGNLALQITFTEPVVAGSGTLDVIDGNDFTTVVASFDITDSADVTISGSTVTFATFPAVGASPMASTPPRVS